MIYSQYFWLGSPMIEQLHFDNDEILWASESSQNA